VRELAEENYGVRREAPLRRDRDAKGVKGEGNRGCSSPQPTRGSMGERRKLPAGYGRKRDLVHFEL